MSAGKRLVPGVCAVAWLTLLASCFEAKIDARAAAPDALPADGPDLDAGAEALPDAAEAVHPECGPPPPGGSAAQPFEQGKYWAADDVNAFLDYECDPKKVLPTCEPGKPCAFGKCLYLDSPTAGVCVDDTRCEAPLAFQNGRCSACISNADKAAIRCANKPRVDYRRWPWDSVSGIGGFCTANDECEAGLSCAAGRGKTWLGTCACPGASLDSLSSFVGCGTPDTPRDFEAELAVFSVAEPARIMLAGDSIAEDVLGTVVLFLGDGDSNRTSVRQDAPPIEREAAICDFLTDRPSAVPAERRLRAYIESARPTPPDDTNRTPHLVVMQFWGTTSSACMAGLELGSEAYYQRILADAEAAVAEIEAATIRAPKPQMRPRILWVLQGPDYDQPDRIRRLNQIYRLVASEHGDRTSDAGRSVSRAQWTNVAEDRYVWVSALLCFPAERAVPALCPGGYATIHHGNDRVGFCLRTSDGRCDSGRSAGVMRYAAAIMEDIRRWLSIPALTP